MSNDGYVAPVNHSTSSAVASTIGGATGGALKGGLAGWATGLLAPVAIGAAVFAGVAAFVVGGGTLGLIGAAAIVGAGVGAVGSYFAAIPTAVIGATLGLAKGASRASDEVKMERGQAALLSAQVQAATAQGVAYASNDNKYQTPVHGSAMNPAMATIQANSAQSYGTLSSQQLVRA